MNNSPKSVIMLNDIINTPLRNQASPMLTGSDVSNLTDIWRENHPFYGPPSPTSVATTPSHVRTLFEPEPIDTAQLRELMYETRIDEMLTEVNTLKRQMNELFMTTSENEVETEERFNKLIHDNDRKVNAIKRKAIDYMGDAMLSLSRAKTARFLGDSYESHMDEAFNAVSDGLDDFLNIKKER